MPDISQLLKGFKLGESIQEKFHTNIASISEMPVDAVYRKKLEEVGAITDGIVRASALDDAVRGQERLSQADGLASRIRMEDLERWSQADSLASRIRVEDLERLSQGDGPASRIRMEDLERWSQADARSNWINKADHYQVETQIARFAEIGQQREIKSLDKIAQEMARLYIAENPIRDGAGSILTQSLYTTPLDRQSHSSSAFQKECASLISFGTENNQSGASIHLHDIAGRDLITAGGDVHIKNIITGEADSLSIEVDICIEQGDRDISIFSYSTHPLHIPREGEELDLRPYLQDIFIVTHIRRKPSLSIETPFKKWEAESASVIVFVRHRTR